MKRFDNYLFLYRLGFPVMLNVSSKSDLSFDQILNPPSKARNPGILWTISSFWQIELLQQPSLTLVVLPLSQFNESSHSLSDLTAFSHRSNPLVTLDVSCERDQLTDGPYLLTGKFIFSPEPDLSVPARRCNFLPGKPILVVVGDVLCTPLCSAVAQKCDCCDGSGATTDNTTNMSALALGNSCGSSLPFPVLASSLGSVCKPFPELRRLRIQSDVHFYSDGQGLHSLLKLSPKLLQLELERGLFHVGHNGPLTDPQYLLIESDSLEFLGVEVILYSDLLTLDIRTPKLREAKLGCEFKGAVLIAAPACLSALEINCSAKVTVREPWEQLDSLILWSNPEDFFFWDSNGPLQEALQGCKSLRSFSIQSPYLKNVSDLTGALAGLEELRIHDRLICEVFESKPENLRNSLRELTVFFDEWEVLDEERIFKAVRAADFLPKLVTLRLEDTGSIPPRAVQALVSFQRKRPGVDVQFNIPK